MAREERGTEVGVPDGDAAVAAFAATRNNTHQAHIVQSIGIFLLRLDQKYRKDSDLETWITEQITRFHTHANKIDSTSATVALAFATYEDRNRIDQFDKITLFLSPELQEEFKDRLEDKEKNPGKTIEANRAITVKHTIALIIAATLDDAAYPIPEGCTAETERAHRVTTLLNVLADSRTHKVCHTGQRHNITLTLNMVYPEAYFIEDLEAFIINHTKAFVHNWLEENLTSEEYFNLYKETIRQKVAREQPDTAGEIGEAPDAADSLYEQQLKRIKRESGEALQQHLRKILRYHGLKTNEGYVKNKIDGQVQHLEYIELPSIPEQHLIQEALLYQLNHGNKNLRQSFRHARQLFDSLKSFADPNFARLAKFNEYIRLQTKVDSLLRMTFIGASEGEFKHLLETTVERLEVFFENFDTHDDLSELTAEIDRFSDQIDRHTFSANKSFIENFFATYNPLKSRRKRGDLWQRLKRTKNNVVLSDDELTKFLTTNTDEKGITAISPYEINRILLHAHLQPINEWSSIFFQCFSAVLEFIDHGCESPDQGPAIFRSLVESSYKRSLMDSCRLLKEAYELREKWLLKQNDYEADSQEHRIIQTLITEEDKKQKDHQEKLIGSIYSSRSVRDSFRECITTWFARALETLRTDEDKKTLYDIFAEDLQTIFKKPYSKNQLVRTIENAPIDYLPKLLAAIPYIAEIKYLFGKLIRKCIIRGSKPIKNELLQTLKRTNTLNTFLHFIVIGELRLNNNFSSDLAIFLYEQAEPDNYPLAETPSNLAIVPHVVTIQRSSVIIFNRFLKSNGSAKLFIHHVLTVESDDFLQPDTKSNSLIRSLEATTKGIVLSSIPDEWKYAPEHRDQLLELASPQLKPTLIGSFFLYDLQHSGASPLELLQTPKSQPEASPEKLDEIADAILQGRKGKSGITNIDQTDLHDILQNCTRFPSLPRIIANKNLQNILNSNAAINSMETLLGIISHRNIDIDIDKVKTGLHTLIDTNRFPRKTRNDGEEDIALVFDLLDKLPRVCIPGTVKLFAKKVVDASKSNNDPEILISFFYKIYNLKYDLKALDSITEMLGSLSSKNTLLFRSELNFKASILPPSIFYAINPERKFQSLDSRGAQLPFFFQLVSNENIPREIVQYLLTMLMKTKGQDVFADLFIGWDVTISATDNIKNILLGYTMNGRWNRFRAFAWNHNRHHLHAVNRGLKTEPDTSPEKIINIILTTINEAKGDLRSLSGTSDLGRRLRFISLMLFGHGRFDQIIQTSAPTTTAEAASAAAGPPDAIIRTSAPTAAAGEATAEAGPPDAPGP